MKLFSDISVSKDFMFVKDWFNTTCRIICCKVVVVLARGSKRNFARQNKTALGQKSKSKFYIITFLNKLKIVENTPNNQNKMFMTWAMGPFRDSHVPSCSAGPGPMYRRNLLL